MVAAYFRTGLLAFAAQRSMKTMSEPNSIPHSRPCLTEKDKSAVEKVLSSGMIAEGAAVKAFEKAVSDYLQLAGGLATSSGTDALFLGLKSLNLAAGDEVVMPTYVCRAVWDAVHATGATPVLCDVSDDWCMNADTVKPAITNRTKAVIVVHTFGIVADIEPICALGVPVIEDCCQSFGAKHKGTLAGTFGRLCILSFHATKLLTTGEGGMVLTDDADLLDRLRSLKHGDEMELVVRYRFAMSDLQAALGLSQLQRYEGFLARRREIAGHYFEQLEELQITLPIAIKDRSIFFRFPLRVPDFEPIRRAFEAEGIQVRRGVDVLLHRNLGLDPAGFPQAERCYAETVSIPLYPALRDNDCQRIVEACQRSFGRIRNSC
jgi:perosamine synthetase